MDFPALINQFKVLTESAKDEDTLYSFMMSVKYHIQGYFPLLNNGENIKHDEKHNEDAADILSEIAADLRTRVPMEAQLKSEKIVFPETGQVKSEPFLSNIVAIMYLSRMRTVILGRQCMLMRSSTMTGW